MVKQKQSASEYNIRQDNIAYLFRLIDIHGYDVLRKQKKYYNRYEKEDIINRILIDNESICSVSIETGLSSDGILHNRIKENGYNIIERKCGKSPNLIMGKNYQT